MSPAAYRVLHGLKLRAFAQAAQQYYDWLDKLASNTGPGREFAPTHEIEAGLALAACKIVGLKPNIDDLSRRAGTRLMPRHVEREVNRIAAIVAEHVTRWKWGESMTADGEALIAAKLDEHHQRYRVPFLRGCLAWRSMPDVKRHALADRIADDVEEVGLEPLDLSGIADPAEHVAELGRAWRDTPALSGTLPSATTAELDALARAVDAVQCESSLASPESAAPDGEATGPTVEPKSPTATSEATPPAVEIETSATADDGFVSFKEAARLTALKPYEITRACDSGRVRSLGKRRGRTVHAADLARWLEEYNKL